MNHNLPTRLLIALVTSMMGGVVCAQPGDKPAQPRLVVGIMVEDLQQEYIDQLRDYFSKGGFNRLLDNGVLLSKVDYGTNLDVAAATAMIYTGASPSVNGIPAQDVFDLSTLKSVPVFSDSEFLGNFTTQTLSPAALLTSTISDELRVAGDGLTLCYAIAPDPAQALVMAGHAGNYGSWINDANDSWATTTFYKEDTRPINLRNRQYPLSAHLDTVKWAPVFDTFKYTNLIPRHLTRSPFSYSFNLKGPARMQSFKNSPLVNSAVTDFALDHISTYDLGAHDGPDMISLAYTLQPFGFSRNPDNRYELVDAYYRLDRDLEKILMAIDKKVGLPNTLVFVAATPPVARSRRDDERWNIPYGEFSTRKAISLLNLYLIAIHGNGNWIAGYHNGEFFLNRDLIKKENKDLELMRQQSAAFLMQMAGVADAYSLNDVVNKSSGVITDAVRRNVALAHAGDVKISVMPGWEILDDFNNPSVKPHQVAREQAATAPVIIMAPGLASKEITRLVDARAIAPTVTRLLRIRSPNAASQPPLSLE